MLNFAQGSYEHSLTMSWVANIAKIGHCQEIMLMERMLVANKVIFVFVMAVASCAAFAQTVTYTWTNPNDKFATTLTLPSSWSFSAFSSDGTISTAPTGAALHTAAGNWGWAGTSSSRPGEYNFNLNGAFVGIGTQIEVNHGGKLYNNTLNLGWFVWNGTTFVNSPAP
jgi:hypothetical protein